MPAELICLVCSTPLTGAQTKFCCHRHAMKWHNSRSPWQERKDRHKKNAERKAAYRADPEFWRNKTRKWREDNPEKAALFALKSKEQYWAKPWRKLIIAAKGRAAIKNLPFDLTFEWGETRWTGFCEVSKLPFSPRENSLFGAFSPSIDRIDAAKGYTQNNCRFVLMAVNGLKHTGTDATMYLIAEAIVAHKPDQNAAPASP